LLAASPATLAIPGTGSLIRLEENVAAARLHLTAEDLHDMKAAHG
jgi:pyridoxine 4-dehydrogenase